MDEKMIDLLGEINDQAGILIQVKYLIDIDYSKSLEAVVLVFENKILTISVFAEEDTIELQSCEPLLDDSHKLIGLSNNNPWSFAIGKSLRWGWLLMNQQGYLDAIQFEFANNISDNSVIVQLVAVASRLRVYKLDRCSL
jgi:Family of unknown function (DUF6334)